MQPEAALRPATARALTFIVDRWNTFMKKVGSATVIITSTPLACDPDDRGSLNVTVAPPLPSVIPFWGVAALAATFQSPYFDSSAPATAAASAAVCRFLLHLKS